MRELLFRAENFRAFTDTGFVPIRPITLLVGENSTGKSSFLAALYFLLRLSDQDSAPEINFPPFDLGSFEQIVHNHSTQDRAEFVISAKKRIDLKKYQGIFYGIFRQQEEDTTDNNNIIDATIRISVEGIFGSPYITGIEISEDETNLLGITLYPKISGYLIDSERNIEKYDLPSGVDLDLGLSNPKITFINKNLIIIVLSLFQDIISNKKRNSNSDISVRRLILILGAMLDDIPNDVEASSPLRSTPERVYSSTESKEIFDGSSTPYYLRKAKIARKDSWNSLRKRLSHFGKLAGLFTDLDISKLTKEVAGPFQIKMKVGTRRETIADVGYGVSQILPIVTNIIESSNSGSNTFLIQQPEVHLHPRAQAGLGTFFSTHAAKNLNDNLIIETHSDYLIDRIRLSVKNKELPYLSVSILYFEDKGDFVNIHKLSLDKNGDLIDPPQCYRDFFIREQAELLGISI